MITRQLCIAAVLSASLLVVGCQEQLPDDEPLSRVDLRTALDRASLEVIGVAVTPDTGAWLVFDGQTGIYEVDAEGNASTLLTMDAMPDPGVAIRYPFTDLVALGGGQFALTAIGDGFLLDVGAQTMQQHFCYVPDALPTELDQVTNAVAYDPTTEELIAQPQTFDPASGEIVGSQIARYDRASGIDLEWHDVRPSFLAGGMVVEAGGTLLLGEGSTLVRYNFATRTMDEVDELSRFGVTSIDGLAIDTRKGSLVVVDNARDEVVEIGLHQLAD